MLRPYRYSALQYSRFQPPETAGAIARLRAESMAADEPQHKPKEQHKPERPERRKAAAAAAAFTARAVRALMLCNLCRNFATRVRMGTELEIWMREYGDNLAGMAVARGNLESAAGVLSFVIGPPLAGLSDSIGRRPLLIAAPFVNVVISSLVAWRPSVAMLRVRRMTMAFTQISMHGESASLADLFKEDAAAYGTAKAQINVVGDIADVVCPMIGAALATWGGLGLPWAVGAGCFGVMAVVSYLFLEETLRDEERVPFKLRTSNPLAFVKLFCRGPRLRLVAICKMWSRAFCGRWSTYRYEEMHQQQLLQWDLQERGRYSSCECPRTLCCPRGLLLSRRPVHRSRCAEHACQLHLRLAAAHDRRAEGARPRARLRDGRAPGRGAQLARLAFLRHPSAPPDE